MVQTVNLLSPLGVPHKYMFSFSGFYVLTLLKKNFSTTYRTEFNLTDGTSGKRCETRRVLRLDQSRRSESVSYSIQKEVVQRVSKDKPYEVSLSPCIRQGRPSCPSLPSEVSRVGFRYSPEEVDGISSCLSDTHPKYKFVERCQRLCSSTPLLPRDSLSSLTVLSPLLLSRAFPSLPPYFITWNDLGFSYFLLGQITPLPTTKIPVIT